MRLREPEPDQPVDPASRLKNPRVRAAQVFVLSIEKGAILFIRDAAKISGSNHRGKRCCIIRRITEACDGGD
jgi:hypothetical protein